MRYRRLSFGLSLVACFAALVAVESAQAKGRKAQGAEFIDPPEPDPSEAVEEEEEADTKEAAGYVPGYRSAPAMGLSPHAPLRQPSLPGGMTPAFGAPKRDGEFRFDFHGYLQAPLRVGIGSRSDATTEQYETTLHADPVLPGASYGWFDHSQTLPGPWAQVNFIYGNDTVQANMVIGSWSWSEPMDAAQYFQPNGQPLFNEAFLTYTPEKLGAFDLRLNVGAFSDRYGAMGQYDEGRYGVSLIGGVQGVGVTGTLGYELNEDHSLSLEYGFKGDLNKAPRSILPDGSNEHAREIEGSTYAQHAHVGASLYGTIDPSIHFITSWSQDDRADPVDDPQTDLNESYLRADGRLTVFGADLRVRAGRFGHFYAGVGHVVGDDTLSISNLVQVLYSGSGRDLMERYWGFESGGNGTLSVFGGQYSLSLGTLLRYPTEYWGVGPDLILSAFGIGAHVTSRQEEFDDKDMAKYGLEATYSIAKWFAVSGRFDHVRPDLDEPSRSFGTFSPKLVFRTDWNAREAVTLQYARYFLGSNVRVEGDQRLQNSSSGDPDQHLLAIYGTMWW